MGVRIASTATTSGLALLMPAPARPSLTSFLEILTNASDEEAGGSELMNSGAETEADSSLANGAASSQEDSALPSGTGDENVRATADRPSVAQKLPSTAQRLSGGESASRTNNGSSGFVNGEPARATSIATDVLIRAGVPTFSSYAMPFSRTGNSGIAFPTSPANSPGQEIPGNTTVNPGANSAAEAGAASRPANGQGPISIVSASEKVSFTSTSTVAPLAQTKTSTAEKPSGPENGRWAKSGSFGVVDGERARTMAGLKSALISSTATSFVPTAQPFQTASASGDTAARMPVGSLEQEASRGSAMRDGAKTYADASVGKLVATQQQVAPLRSIAGNGIAAGTAAVRPSDPIEPSSPVKANVQASLLPERTSSAIAKGEGWRGMLDDSSVSIPSQSAVSGLPAQLVPVSAPSVETSARPFADAAVARRSANSSIESGERSPANELGALTSAPKTTFSPSRLALISAGPYATSFQRTLASVPEVDISGLRLMGVETSTHPDAKIISTSAPAAVSGSSAPAPQTTRPTGGAIQGTQPSASDKEASERVLMNATVTTQVSEAFVHVSLPVPVSSSFAQPPAQARAFRSGFEPATVAAPEQQVSGSGLVDPNARTIPIVLSADAPVTATVSGSSASLPIQTKPMADIVQEIVPTDLDRKAVENILTNATVKTQVNQTRISVSSPVAEPNPLVRRPTQTNPVSTGIEQEAVAAPEQKASGSGLVDPNARTIPIALSTDTSVSATIPSSSSQSPAQTRQTINVVQENVPGNSEKPASGNVLVDGTVKTQVNQPPVQVALPVAVSSSPAQQPARASTFRNGFDPMRMPMAAPEEQVPGNGLRNDGARTIPTMLSADASVTATISSSSAQLPIQTKPIAGIVHEAIPSQSNKESFGIGPMDTTVRTQVDQPPVQVALPVAVLSSSAQPPAQTSLFRNGSEPPPLAAPQGQISENSMVDPAAWNLTSALNTDTSTPATISTPSTRPPKQTRPTIEIVQGMTPSAPDKETSETVGMNSSVDAQAVKTSGPVSSPAAIPSAFSYSSAPIEPSSDRFEQGLVSAPATKEQVSAIGLTDAGAQRISATVSVSSPELAPISISSAQAPIQSTPTANTAEMAMPQASEKEPSGSFLINATVKAQVDPTSVPVSLPVTASSLSPQPPMQIRPTIEFVRGMTPSIAEGRGPGNVLVNSSPNMQAITPPVPVSSSAEISSSFERPATEIDPSGARFEPALVSAPTTKEQVSGDGFTNAGVQKIPTVPSVSISEQAPISDAPSQPPMETASSFSIVQLPPSSAAKQENSENGSNGICVEADEVIGIANQQQQTQSPVPVEHGRIGSAADVLSDTHVEALTDQAPSGREDRARTIVGPTSASAEIVNVQGASAMQELTPQQTVSPSAPDVKPSRQIAMPQKTAAPQQTAIPSNPLGRTAPQIAPDHDKPAIPADSEAGPDTQSDIAAPATDGVFILPEALPMAAVAADNESGNRPTGNAIEKAAASASGSRNPMLAKGADAATSKTTDGASDAGGNVQHGAQNTPQSSQGTQADLTHVADAAPRSIDSEASQAQTQAQAIPLQFAAPGAAVAHRAPEASGAATGSGEQQVVAAPMHSDGGEAVATSSVNTAKLMQTMSESEMHVGMRSSEFGDISIRTSVTQQQMVTRILLDHSDLSQAISAHVSTMQAKLGEELGLNASIEVHSLGSQLSGEQGQSSPRDQRAFNQSAQGGSVQSVPEEEPGLSMAALANAGNGSRLDIRA